MRRVWVATARSAGPRSLPTVPICSADSSTSTTAPQHDRIRVSDPHGVIETMRAECLDWTLIWGRWHLDRTLLIYGEHYNRGRPHRALGLASPLATDGEPIPVNPRDVRRRDLLGGLIHEYDGAAA